MRKVPVINFIRTCDYSEMKSAVKDNTKKSHQQAKQIGGGRTLSDQKVTSKIRKLVAKDSCKKPCQ